jgi:hypothetical protein
VASANLKTKETTNENQADARPEAGAAGHHFNSKLKMQNVKPGLPRENTEDSSATRPGVSIESNAVKPHDSPLKGGLVAS